MYVCVCACTYINIKIYKYNISNNKDTPGNETFYVENCPITFEPVKMEENAINGHNRSTVKPTNI